MATMFVGDVQGCYTELLSLLDQVKFDPKNDTLWFVGDLVARGPNSLETLRFVRDLGKAAKIVLGNHELNLLAVAAGVQQAKSSDRLEKVLQAPDRDLLLYWLRQQPLIQYHKEFSIIMVHAGISQQWDLKTTLDCARLIHLYLSGDNYQQILSDMYGDDNIWFDELPKHLQKRYILNVFTRMRYCYSDGKLDFQFKKNPQQAPNMLLPWFQLPLAINTQVKHIVFGHWATLMGRDTPPGFYALDTACVWGHYLTMLRWEDQQYFTKSAINLKRF